MKRVVGLRWANMIEREPFPLAAGRSRSQREGKRYEAGLAKGLGARFQWGVWWEYRDRNGIGYCQTDFFGRGRDWIVLLESKLTWTQEAEEQLWELYVPVVGLALGVERQKILPIVVCKYLTRDADRPICETLQDTMRKSMEVSTPFCAVWHHIGGIPMLKTEESCYA